jgi:hypothetical protein
MTAAAVMMTVTKMNQRGKRMFAAARVEPLGDNQWRHPLLQG